MALQEEIAKLGIACSKLAWIKNNVRDPGLEYLLDDIDLDLMNIHSYLDHHYDENLITDNTVPNDQR